MNAEMIARLLMVLTGFVLAMLGVITFVHSGDHKMLGILISFAGVVSMFGGLPDTCLTQLNLIMMKDHTSHGKNYHNDRFLDISRYGVEFELGRICIME